MKKLILSISCLIITTSLSAQITVSSTHIATVGDTVFLSEDTLNGTALNLGTPGGDKIWDFTFLEAHLPDGAVFFEPSTAPLSNMFPDADFVINDTEDSAHVFFKQTSSYLDIVGFVEYDSIGNPVIPEFNISQRYFEFPSTSSDTFSSSSYAGQQSMFIGIDPDTTDTFPAIDSLRTMFYYEAHSEIDAWGLLKLPNGDYSAIRQRAWSRGRLETDWYGDGSWQQLSTSPYLTQFDSVSYDTSDNVTYRWWSDNASANFWICEVELDSNGTPFKDVSYSHLVPTPPVGVDDKSELEITVYPNPVSNALHISGTETTSSPFCIYDLQGKVVLTGNITENNTINTAVLSSGSYLLQVADGHEGILLLKRFEVLR